MKINEKILALYQQRKLNQELNMAIKTICKLGVIEDMDSVFNFDAFKIRVENSILANKNNGTIFMGDIDNLGTVVNSIGNEKSNQYIVDLIKRIKDTMRQNGIHEYDIGKLGDEIYLYVPKINEEKSEQALQKLNEVKNELLSISFGKTDKLDEGLEKAIEEADEKMRALKAVRKKEQLDKMSKEQIIKIWLEQIDNKLRINEKNLTYEQKRLYKDNKKLAIRRVVKELAEDKSENTKNEKLDTENETKVFQERIKETEQSYLDKYKYVNIDNKKMEILIIAKMLLKSPIKGVRKISYFYRNAYKKLSILNSKPLTIRNLKNTKLMSINLGNIKYVNDNYGHNKCDKYVYDLIKEIQKIIKSEKIKLKTKIISKGISDYYLLFDSRTSNKKIEILKEKIEELEKKQKFTINCSTARPLINNKAPLTRDNKTDTIKDLIIKAFEDTVEKNEKETKMVSTDKKIRNIEIIYSAVKKQKEIVQEMLQIKSNSLGETAETKREEKLREEKPRETSLNSTICKKENESKQQVNRKDGEEQKNEER